VELADYDEVKEWRSPFGATEDRNETPAAYMRRTTPWRSSLKETEDRNAPFAARWDAEAAVAVAFWGDRGLQRQLQPRWVEGDYGGGCSLGNRGLQRLFGATEDPCYLIRGWRSPSGLPRIATRRVRLGPGRQHRGGGLPG
jgi:hypothetical protein